MAANLLLCLMFVGPFGVRGLGLALSLSAILEFSLLFRSLRRKLGGLDEEVLVGSVAKSCAATVVMAEVVGLLALLLHAAGHLNTGTLGDAFLALFGGTVIGAVAFLAVSSFLGSEEMEVLRFREQRGADTHAVLDDMRGPPAGCRTNLSLVAFPLRRGDRDRIIALNADSCRRDLMVGDGLEFC
jgi:hypothetical protein